VLFSAVALFEAKRKGYSFIPYHVTVKVREKSKSEKGSLVCTTLAIPRLLADRRHMAMELEFGKLQLQSRTSGWTEVVQSHFLINV